MDSSGIIMYFWVCIFLISGVLAQEDEDRDDRDFRPTFSPRMRVTDANGNDVTGEPLPQIDCPREMCNGKDNGNYEYRNNGETRENYFVSCMGGIAYCQPCFPLTLVFKEECNQCVYSMEDSCYTTQPYTQSTLPAFDCPSGRCPSRDEDFSGNVADPNERRHYIACWKGMVTGCVTCPYPLLFNEEENSCLYDGKYMTEPSGGNRGNNNNNNNERNNNNGRRREEEEDEDRREEEDEEKK